MNESVTLADEFSPVDDLTSQEGLSQSPLAL